MVEDRYPLSRVADAYRDLEEGKLRGRAVAIPDGNNGEKAVKRPLDGKD